MSILSFCLCFCIPTPTHPVEFSPWSPPQESFPTSPPPSGSCLVPLSLCFPFVSSHPLLPLGSWPRELTPAQLHLHRPAAARTTKAPCSATTPELCRFSSARFQQNLCSPMISSSWSFVGTCGSSYVAHVHRYPTGTSSSGGCRDGGDRRGPAGPARSSGSAGDAARLAPTRFCQRSHFPPLCFYTSSPSFLWRGPSPRSRTAEAF